MKATHSKFVGAIAKTFTIALSVAIAGNLSAQSPYTPGSAADNRLNFSAGAGGDATAPLPTLTVGVGISSGTDVGNGGGWNLTASGASNIGIDILGITTSLGSTQANTLIGGNSLSFQALNTGTLSGLASAGIALNWSASTTVTESTGWAANNYIYQFDMDLTNSLLGLNPDLLGSFTLVISDNSGTLYSSSTLGDLLGISGVTNLQNASFTDVQAEFAYDPVNGPLNISFFASSPIDANALAIIDDSTTNTLYNVSGAEIIIAPVPEPGSVILLGVSGMLLIFRRRRA